MLKEFETGSVRENDDHKPDYVEALSYTALNRYVRFMTSKKTKYGANNFKKGIPIESYERSLMRHIDKYFRNKYEGGDDEKGDDQLSAILFNVFGIMHQEEIFEKKRDKIKKRE